MAEFTTININNVPEKKAEKTDYVEVYGADGVRKKATASSISDIWALKKKTVVIPSVTIGSQGYSTISDYVTIPTFETNAEFFMFANMRSYSNGDGVLAVDGQGKYIMGKEGVTYINVIIDYFYC